MALLGRGALAIWNGIKPEAEDEFVAWHTREHIPECLSLPGFLRGRRYIAREGEPKYFTFYETTTTADLSSPAYRARIDAPSAWTKEVEAHFTDTSRSECDAAWSIGLGEGGFIEAIQIDSSLAAKPLATGLHDRMSAAVAGLPGIVGVHLLQGQLKAGKSAAWILLVEASRPEALDRFRAEAGSNDALGRCGAGPDVVRGFYQLQFALPKAELASAKSSVQG